MKNKKIIYAIVAVVLVVLVVGMFFIFKGKGETRPNNNTGNGQIVLGGNEVVDNNNGAVVNVTDNINEAVIEVKEFEVSNIDLKYEDGMTNFRMDIKNNSKIDYPEGTELLITFYDASGNVIHKVPAITSTLLAGKSSSISARTTIDCTGANDIAITVVE